MRIIKKSATSQSLYFEVLDSTSSTGGRKIGLVFNTSGLTAYYVRNGAASVAITLATLSLASSAWSSGGFKEVDATNMPGIYRLDVPDAAFATGAESVIVTIKGATGMAQISSEVQLEDNTDLDIFNRLGAPAGASVSADIAAVKSDTGTILTDVNIGAGAIYTRLGAPAGASIAADIAALPTATTVSAIKTQTDKFAFTVPNQVDCNVLDWKSSAAPAMTGDAFARLGAPAGASVSADIAAVKSDTGTILTDVNTGAGAIYTRLGAPAGASIAADIAAVKGVLPAALVGGRIDANIGSVTAGAIVAASFAAGAFGAVWDIVLSGHLTAGTTGLALNAAGSAGDPWSTAIPGAYGAGTAGNIVGNNLNATVSSRLAASGYTAPDNTDIAAIKAKTDNLPADPSSESLIIAATNALGSSIAALPTATANANGLLDLAAGVETGWTLRQALRIMLSALGAKSSGLATTTAVFRDMNDTKNRITATVDANGDRSSITYDAS